MLYRRVNGCFVNANDSDEVVKVFRSLPKKKTHYLFASYSFYLQYINGTLKVKFELDNTSKTKPVAGPDDLLLLLVHHWARDESVFPTEDDRHDIATIMLFQSYTGGRPAEFVHSSKGKASQDPLGEAENATFRKSIDKDYDDVSDPDSDIDELFDDDGDDNAAAGDMDKRPDQDNCSNSDNMDVTMSADTDNCYA